MTSDGFKRRGVALEDEFFRRIDMKLQEDLRKKWDHEREVDALKRESRIEDDRVIEELLSVGVHSGMIRVMTLIPAVHVAWSNGYVDTKEREAIEHAAQAHGITDESTTGQLLASWLDHKPGGNLFHAWCDYVRELQKVLDTSAFRHLHENAVATATKIAEAAGGFLGVQSISSNEQAAIQQIDDAFGKTVN